MYIKLLGGSETDLESRDTPRMSVVTFCILHLSSNARVP
jgi:hypothetical protein